MLIKTVRGLITGQFLFFQIDVEILIYFSYPWERMCKWPSFFSIEVLFSEMIISVFNNKRQLFKKKINFFLLKYRKSRVMTSVIILVLSLGFILKSSLFFSECV